MTVVPFRYPTEKRRRLEAVQKLKGHASLSDTLREAVDEYVQRELARLAAQAPEAA